MPGPGSLRAGGTVALLLLAACGAEPWTGGTDARAAEHVREARARQAQAARHFGLPLELLDAAGMRYRLVPPGDVPMGSPGAEPGRAEDESPFEAHLPVPYFLQATETRWGEVRRWRPDLGERAPGEPDDAPARGLTHAEASEYAAWLNQRDAHLFHRLPSEAEWEHACRAGANGPWGTGIDPAVAARVAAAPVPCGSTPANAWGFSEMHGNVAEWCRTWYAPYPSSAGDLPTGPRDGTERVVRGGSYAEPDARRRAAARGRLAPTARDERVGVRLLVEVGYAVPGLGVHDVRAQTYAGEFGRPDRPARPGYRIRLVSVAERLTARQEDRTIRWVDLEGTTPMTVRMLPGRYYFQAFEVVDGEVVRGMERKFAVPDDLPEIEVDVPPARREDAR